MKKLWLVVLAAALVLVLVNVPGSVSAIFIPPSDPVAGGAWTGGTPVPVDFSGTTYPNWLVPMDTTGVWVRNPEHICHPFQGGQDGWVADIRVLVGKQWEPVTTTQGWMPDEEGTYMACATAPGWGTYALFGYFDEARAPKAAFDESVCDYEDWMIYSWWHGSTYPWPVGYSLEVYLGADGEFPLGETVTYEIVGAYPIAGFGIPQSGSTVSWYDGDIYATFTDYVYDELPDPSFVRLVKVSTGGCSTVLAWDSDVTYMDLFFPSATPKPQ
ncbi:MAG: hypothetical protein HPY85_15645 [Anaerolineae bacterium]|nr:hypothetical protein [Anaerolineae bacterium]